MLQRIQSVWLLLAAIFAAVTFSVSFYVGALPDATGLAIPTQLNAKTNLLLTVLTVFAGGIALVDIFLFFNRKLQSRIAVLGLIFTVALLAVYIIQMRKFTSGSFALGCILHFGILVLYILAIKGISHDEKLIKSLDRLR